jgi:hypothetical protein
MSLKDRFASAWNAFQSEEKRRSETTDEAGRSLMSQIGSTSYFRQDRHRMRYSSERSILNSIFNRIANDVASIQIQHVRVDSNDRFVDHIKSSLNDCITLSANIDQTARDFWVDVTLSMLDEGVIAVVPVDTNVNLDRNNSFDILSLRTGKIVDWMPSYVRVNVYNDRNGQREDITLPKDKVAILENPFYSVMNEPNSTLKRLVYKMNLLDQIDGQKASSKLNLLVQLPYSLKSPSRQAQAEERRKMLEDQLVGSKYGVGYIDSTEHVTQLNRSIENDLPNQITTLTEQLYNQIGISGDVFRGTANQEQMLVYNKKVLKPILDTIELEFTRKFLTPTARTQGQKIAYYIDAFDLVTPDEVANMANAFSRNEILSANEVRAILGYKASDNPRSDELINKNMPIDKIAPGTSSGNQNGSNSGSLADQLGGSDLDGLEDLLNEANDNGDFDETERLLDELESQLG